MSFSVILGEVFLILRLLFKLKIKVGSKLKEFGDTVASKATARKSAGMGSRRAGALQTPAIEASLVLRGSFLWFKGSLRCRAIGLKASKFRPKPQKNL